MLPSEKGEGFVTRQLCNLQKIQGKGFQFDASPVGQDIWQNWLVEDPHIPKECSALLRHVDMLHGDHPTGGFNGSRIARRLARGLRNPALGDDDISAVDELYDSKLDDLPESYVSNDFIVQYTTTGDSGISGADAAAVGDVLDKWQQRYIDEFGITPYQTATEIDHNKPKQIVQIRKLSQDDGDGYSTYKTPIIVDNRSMSNDHNRPFTTAHELFHCVQYELGMDRLPAFKTPGWFVEGLANWAGLFLTNGVNDGGWDAFTRYQSIPGFTKDGDAGTSMFPIWIYLTTSWSGDDATYTVPIQWCLQFYGREGDPLVALNEVISKLNDTSKPPLFVGAPGFYAQYVAALATDAWRSTTWLEGSEWTIMDYCQKLTDYDDGSTDDPPAIKFTDESHLRLGGDQVMGDLQVSPGCADLLKFNLVDSPPSGDKFQLSLTLGHNDGADPAVAICMVSIDENGPLQLSHSHVLSGDDSSGTYQLTLDKGTPTAVLVAVIDELTNPGPTVLGTNYQYNATIVGNAS